LKARGKAANSRREIVFKDPWRRADSSRKPARARTGSGKTAELPPECGCCHVFASDIFSPDDQANTNRLANPPRLKQERDRRVPRSQSLAVRLAMLRLDRQPAARVITDQRPSAARERDSQCCCGNPYLQGSRPTRSRPAPTPSCPHACAEPWRFHAQQHQTAQSASPRGAGCGGPLVARAAARVGIRICRRLNPRGAQKPHLAVTKTARVLGQFSGTRAIYALSDDDFRMTVAEITSEHAGAILPSDRIAGPPGRRYSQSRRCRSQGVTLARLARFARR